MADREGVRGFWKQEEDGGITQALREGRSGGYSVLFLMESSKNKDAFLNKKIRA
jgi:hypothetical protein